MINKTGPILLIDDDVDDLDLYENVIVSLGVSNQVITFRNAQDFLEYAHKAVENFFLILCDINMPNMNGLELRRLMAKDSSLNMISIPFIFLSTSSSTDHIFKAYSDPIQGYFVKPSNISDITEMFKDIIKYWTSSQHPLLKMP